MTIHINLMSQQLIPNVIPALSHPVDKIYLVVAGEAFKESAEYLKRFYHKKGIEDVELFLCEDPNDFYSLKYKATELFKDIQAFHPNQEVLLNATCGTKPMSLAFTMVFDQLEQKCMPIYTDTLNKRIVILNDNEKVKALPYHDVLSIEDYFYLNHFKLAKYAVDEAETVLEREELTKGILEHALNYQPAISILNKLAQETLFSTPAMFISTVPLRHEPKMDFKAILSLATKHGLIESYDDNSITFRDVDAARYLGGGWLEELNYLAATEAGIKNLAMNVEGHLISGKGEQTSVLNEFDAVLINNNQMLIVEAKTVNWEKQESKGQEATVKLDSLTKLYGGDFGKGLLVSFFPLTEKIKARVDRLRNIDYLHVTSYADLVAAFEHWRKSTESAYR